MAGKLNEQQLQLLRDRYVGDDNPIGLLLGHIDAMQTEWDELVRTADALFDEKDQRIKELEGEIRRGVQDRIEVLEAIASVAQEVVDVHFARECHPTVRKLHDVLADFNANGQG